MRAPDAAHRAAFAAWCVADPGSMLHAVGLWVPALPPLAKNAAPRPGQVLAWSASETEEPFNDKLLISRHDIRHRPLELLCRRALTDHGAEGGISRHFRIAPAPGHAAFGVEPDQPLGSFRNAAQDIGARIEVVGAGVAEHDHRRLRRHRLDP